MHFGTREKFEYFECSSCGCLQIGVIPSDMSEYYPSDYYSFKGVEDTTIVGKIKNILKRQRNKYASTAKGIIGKILFNIHPTDMPFYIIDKMRDEKIQTVLDVGSGSGAFLYQLKELGAPNVMGIDPYLQRDIYYKNGLVIYNKTIHDLQKAADKKFDFIMLNHSFEHMADPLSVLDCASDILEDHGTMMIRLPTVSSYAWQYYGPNWVQLDAPRHLYLHSLKSMNILSEQAGFAIIDVNYDSNELQFWGSEQYIKDIPLASPKSFKRSPRKSIFKKREINKFRQRAGELNSQNRGDQAAFFLKKVKK